MQNHGIREGTKHPISRNPATLLRHMAGVVEVNEAGVVDCVREDTTRYQARAGANYAGAPEAGPPETSPLARKSSQVESSQAEIFGHNIARR